ncbi:hypothetical protein PanWU01x14_112570 [Parasponia andersonii]|uniref:Uncharacterized protein n=1 Tax=Parasponia andersonii TaxID=3476 RepID=A0A2P5CYA4_PARAD|nr:hypothetical protein PanWU01x14_112570 [Parasponia andersonii]
MLLTKTTGYTLALGAIVDPPLASTSPFYPVTSPRLTKLPELQDMITQIVRHPSLIPTILLGLSRYLSRVLKI